MVAGAILGFATFGLFAAGRALSPHAHFPDPDVLIRQWSSLKSPVDRRQRLAEFP